MRTRLALLAVLAVPSLGLARPACVAAQVGTHRVSGRVVERGTENGIAGATVRLDEQHSAVTNDSGEFEMRGVRPGRYSLTVEALGWAPVQTVLTVTDDVTGIIRMDPSPVQLDTIGVRPARFTLSGRVIDARTGHVAPYVTIHAGSATTTSNDAGFFRIRNLARGTNTVRTEGFGWMPIQRIVELDGDTTITLALSRDAIMERIIAAHIDTLSKRVAAVGEKLREVNRTSILDSRAASPIDVLRSEAQVRIVDCPDQERERREFGVAMSSINVCVVGRHGPVRPIVYIDERQVCGLEVFDLYPNAMFERIEVVADGSVVRAYTTNFLENMIAGRAMMHPYTQFERPQRC